MFIEQFRADVSGIKKVRITEEFAQLLITPTSGVIENTNISVYLERKGKNVELINRLPLKRIKHLSSNIESVKLLGEDIPFVLSLFESGNFKSAETDAVIVEFNNMTEGLTISLHGLQDFESCSALYKYEPKSVLVGDRNKSFSLAGVERILLPFNAVPLPGTVGIYSEIGFLYRDVNGGLIERKMSPDELLYSARTQSLGNPYDASGYTETDEICLVVDGLEEIKLYHNEPVTNSYDIIFQSKIMLDVNTMQAVNSVANADVSNLVLGTSTFANSPTGSFKRGL